MKRTAVEWLVQGLQERGTEWISALCGHGLDPLFDACHRAGVRIVDVRNEQSAAYIADYSGRLTRRPGVCASSSGVAVANLLTGAMNAWFDGAPMLCLSGSADLATLGLGSFQDSPQVELAAPVTKLSKTLHTASHATQILDEAWQAATGPEPGPVHLMLPMDVQRTMVDEADLQPALAAPSDGGTSSARINGVARALLAAKRPLIIAGSGVFYSGEGEDVVAFAERFRIPVQTPIWDRGVFTSESDSFAGVVGAATGGPDLLAESDCLILAGVSADYRVRYLRDAKLSHRLARGWRELGERYADFGGEARTEWLAQARLARDAYSRTIAERAGSQRQPGMIHAVDVVEALRASLTGIASFLIDGGSIGQWAHQLLCDRKYPPHWLTCGRSGVVGYGLAGAMAARLCRPEAPVVLLSGDGAFTFTVAEIECAVRQKLPFVAIVADDRCWGITHSGHLKQFGQGIATGLGPIRFDLLAESMGARGVRVSSPDEIAPAIRAGIASGEVTVIHVPISGGNPV